MPWSDGTYTSTASYDELDRPLTQSLPIDPNLVATTVQLQLVYNEHGLPKSLNLGGTRWLGVDEYEPYGKPRALSYGNGLSEHRVCEPVVTDWVIRESNATTSAFMPRSGRCGAGRRGRA